MTKYDDIINVINGFGRYQKIRYGLICLAGLLPSFITYIHSFLAATPKIRCKYPDERVNDTSYAHETYNTSHITNSNNITLGKCYYKINNTEYKCKSWVFDKTYFQSTLTEEWDMVCDYSLLSSNVQMIFFIGTLVGSFVLGVLSDKYGRKPIMLASFVLITLGSIGVRFGPQKSIGFLASYIIYAICRFIIAVGTRGINVTGYVLGIETVGSDKITFAGIFFQYFFAIGQLILVGLAYFIRDWKTLALVAIIPTLPFLSYFFFLNESPRWLLLKNRNEEAFKILKKVAKENKRTLDDELLNSLISKEPKEEATKPESLVHVFQSSTLSILTIILCLNWVTNNFIFYGVGLKSSNLGLNPYMTFSISAVVELLGIIKVHFLVDKLGRKKTYGIFLFVAGVACFSIIFIKNTIAVVVLAMFGKFFIAGSYAILYLYSSEIFPTSVRNSGMGTCSMMARIGAIIAPLINGLGEKTWDALPFLIFGLSGMLTGSLTLVLPETRKRKPRPLPKSIKEAEKLYSIKFFELCRKKDKNELKLKLNGTHNQSNGNGHTNGHANGHINGHANGNANGHLSNSDIESN